MCRVGSGERLLLRHARCRAARPAKSQQNGYNIDNVFAVTLRDSGEVALTDGGTKQIINIVKTGYAVHISRISHSGRYVYTIGRDGRIDPIDLFLPKPDRVAGIKIGLGANFINPKYGAVWVTSALSNYKIKGRARIASQSMTLLPMTAAAISQTRGA